MYRPLLILFLTGCLVRVAGAADFAIEAMNATFKLFHPDSTATCFLVRREAPDTALYLVTAAHVLEGTKGETAVVVLREAKADGSFERRDHTIPIRRGETPLWVRDSGQDLAVLRLTAAPPVAVAALPESAIAGEGRLKELGVNLGDPLWVLTFPQRFEANPAGLPVVRHGIFASAPRLPQKEFPTFFADYTTFAGDSGGPVFVPGPADHPVIVGIVLARSSHDEKITGENEERVIHHSLGLGTVLHAQSIRELLATASRVK